MIILSRQARDKHRESTAKKDPRCLVLQWGRIWSGLVNLMKAYEGPLGYEPLHLQIAVRKTTFLRQFILKTTLFYQDRLGTNI